MQDVVVLSRGDEVIEIKLREAKGSTSSSTRNLERQPVPKLRKKPPTSPERKKREE
jgi:hypothetical protein